MLQEIKSGSLSLEKPAAAIRLYAGAKQEQVRKQGSETGEALAALIEGVLGGKEELRTSP